MIAPARLVRIAGTLSLALAPALLLQGHRVRRRTSRLPEAGPPFRGIVAGATPVGLVMLGESTAAGVGVSAHAIGLAGQTAAALAVRLSRGVHWEVRGRNGATASLTRTLLLDTVVTASADVVVLALGVNDTVRLNGWRRFRGDLAMLVDAIRARLAPAVIVFAGVPPLGSFPALPTPLRQVLGLRARALDLAARDLSETVPVLRHASPPTIEPRDRDTFFAADGYHPSAEGYARWAGHIAAAAAAALGGA